MDLRLVYAILLTLAPGTELRLGLPFAILYALDNNIPIILLFFLIILINILLIFIIFFFLDNMHRTLMHLNIYRKTFNFYLERVQRKVDKLEKRYNRLGFYALMLFVAIPLPGTGAWSGCILSWLLGLERKKSLMAIIAGVMIAGALILFGSLGLLMLF
jgi:uncharacterized membrane protein